MLISLPGHSALESLLKTCGTPFLVACFVGSLVSLLFVQVHGFTRYLQCDRALRTRRRLHDMQPWSDLGNLPRHDAAAGGFHKSSSPLLPCHAQQTKCLGRANIVLVLFGYFFSRLF